MSIKFINKTTFLVQVQRSGMRKTKRGTGTETDAKTLEAQLITELEHEIKLAEAAKLLGVERGGKGAENRRVPTFREYFEERWVPHARVVQNPDTQRTSRVPFNYLLYYLGDMRLNELLRPHVVHTFVEKMKDNGPVTFCIRKDGKPRKPRCEHLSNATINKSLQCLKALLNLAHLEEVVDRPPRVNMLPHDDSTPVIPPPEEDFRHLVQICADFRVPAPLLPEVVEFTAETGLRRGEIFHLTWRSVDLPRSAIRVEMQGKGRLVNGQGWRPKHSKWREVPLSKRAHAILVELRAAAPNATPEDLVFPSKGGCPYVRMDRAPESAGKGWFEDAVEAAGLRGKLTFHGLRHLFAVRLLTRGVPITIVSELLGHSDINLTVKRYGRFASDAKVKWEAVKVLDAPEPTQPAPEPPATSAVPTPATTSPAAATELPAETAVAAAAAPAKRKLVALDGGKRPARLAR